MDAETAQAIRRVVDVQLELVELFRQLARAETVFHMDIHNYNLHRVPHHGESEQERSQVSAALRLSERKLRELLLEFPEVPTPAS